MPKLNLFRNASVNKYMELLPDFKKERTQQFITIVFTILALSFFALFAINPTLSTIAKLKKEVKDDLFVENQLKQKIVNLGNLQKEYANVEKDIPVILQAIPNSPDAPVLIADLQGLSVADNVSLTGTQVFEVEVSKEDAASGYSSFLFSVTAEGSYDNLSNFLEGLSTMRRIVTFDNISFSKTSQGSSNLVLNIKGSAYFKK